MDFSDSDSEMQYGNFSIDLPSNLELFSDEYLKEINLYQFDTMAAASTVTSTIDEHILQEILQQPAIDELQKPETPSMSTVKRFKTVTKQQMDALFDARQATATKKNTIWGMKIFQDWSKEKNGFEIDMMEVDSTRLNETLAQFYFEVRPKTSKASNENQEVYHRNSLINIRAAINRKLANLHRNMDIVRDKEFKKSNGVLDGLLKERVRTGVSKPVKHKKIIEKSDLIKISSYLSGAPLSPIILRQCVWYQLAVNFITRGTEFHHQLKIDSFVFHNDDSGEYVTMKHETQQKNFQGGLTSTQNISDKRMYATGGKNCPVKMLRLLLEKTSKNATSLFNQYNKETLYNPRDCEIWYTAKPLAKRSFIHFLSDICKASRVETIYTPHCLRATSIQHLNDEGFEARHIMFMSSHKNESSLRSYNRTVSTFQKRSLSNSLSAITHPNVDDQQKTAADNLHSATVSSTLKENNPQNDNIVVEIPNTCINHNSNTYTPNFFANSTFTSCTFNFQN